MKTVKRKTFTLMVTPKSTGGASQPINVSGVEAVKTYADIMRYFQGGGNSNELGFHYDASEMYGENADGFMAYDCICGIVRTNFVEEDVTVEDTCEDIGCFPDFPAPEPTPEP